MIKTLLALLLSTSTASAGMLCTSMTNKELIKKLGDAGEILNYVGDSGSAVTELTISPKGNWSLLILFPNGTVCFLAAGQNWQAVEPKLPGIEN